MTKPAYWLLVVTVMLIPTHNAVAVETLSAEELAEHCVAFPDAIDSIDGQYCIRYIQGFIDGAIATDVRVMVNIEAESEHQDSFTQRAFRTRLPSRADNERAAGYAEFCLGDPVPLREVVSNVVGDLNLSLESKNSLGSARDAVYDSLRKHYPCKEL
jgi:hypothetical protein